MRSRHLQIRTCSPRRTSEPDGPLRCSHRKESEPTAVPSNRPVAKGWCWQNKGQQEQQWWHFIDANRCRRRAGDAVGLGARRWVARRHTCTLRAYPSCFCVAAIWGTSPVRIAHAVVAELYQCPFEDVDANIAGVVIKGASDSQVRGFMLTSGTLSSAQVAEWLCSAMSPPLRRASLSSIAYAVQRVVDTAAAAAADATGSGPVGAAPVASPATTAGRGPVASSRAESTLPNSGTTAGTIGARRAVAILAPPGFRGLPRPVAGGLSQRFTPTPVAHIVAAAPRTSEASVSPATSTANAAPSARSGTALMPLVAVAHVTAVAAPEVSPMAPAAAAAAGLRNVGTASDA